MFVKCSEERIKSHLHSSTILFMEQQSSLDLKTQPNVGGKTFTAVDYYFSYVNVYYICLCCNCLTV